MLISKKWLQTFFDAPLPDTDALSNAIMLHAFEIDGVEAKGSDEILDVKITPNRGHDALSHRGIAHEVSAILKMPMARDPFMETPVLAPVTTGIKVSIEDPDFCARYIAGYIKGVEVKESEQWLKEALEAIGQRSINNIVDATNYVMFHTGQPLHAFDAGKLGVKDGKFNISIHTTKVEGKILTLDKKEYTLTDSTLIIADENKNNAIGIAGIKGGMAAAVTPETTDIILESANFDGVLIRKTSQALKLRTDASARFEQVLSPSLAAFGMDAAARLIADIAGGELVGFVDNYPKPQRETHVAVTVEKINAVLGTNLTGADIADVFSRLGFAYKEQEGVFEVIVPLERLDISIAEDLIEEVGRIIGYDSIAEIELAPMSASPEINASFYATEKTREELTAQGYSEVFTSVFADKGERAVLNKVDSVRPFMRTTLVDGLNEALKKNIPNKDLLGLKEVKLFEIGYVWKGGKETLMLGTVSEKQKAEEKPLTDIASDAYDVLPLSSAIQFKPFSKYPYIVRDIALWKPENHDEHSIGPTIIDLFEDELKKREVSLLGTRISLYGNQYFDRFEKQGRISLAFRLIFQSFERTLTEIEVNEIMEKVSNALKTKGFEIR